MKHRPIAALCVALSLLLVGCEGAEGPTGPAGPTGPQGTAGPQGPVGPGVSYLVFEGAITASPVGTATQQTGGVPPGIICYLNSDEVPDVWLVLALNIAEETACAVLEDGTGYFGSASVPDTLVNSGWNIRIILFWMT